MPIWFVLLRFMVLLLRTFEQSAFRLPELIWQWWCCLWHNPLYNDDAAAEVQLEYASTLRSGVATIRMMRKMKWQLGNTKLTTKHKSSPTLLRRTPKPKRKGLTII